MTEIRALINQLIAAGVDPAEAAEVVARAAIAGAANSPRPRSAGAIRQERYRRNKASQVTESDAGDDLSSPEGSSPTPPSPKPLQSIPPSPPKGGSSPADEAISAYGAMASRAGLAAVRSVSGARRRNLEARIREHGLPATLEAIGKIERSAFCCGENDRGWRADFDFLCQPKSFVALLEGKYDDRPKQRQQAPPMTFHQQRQQAAIAELDKRLGIKRNDQQPSSALDLDPADWRAHRTASAGH